jgi:hypothetical protein
MYSNYEIRGAFIPGWDAFKEKRSEQQEAAE